MSNHGEMDRISSPNQARCPTDDVEASAMRNPGPLLLPQAQIKKRGAIVIKGERGEAQDSTPRIRWESKINSKLLFNSHLFLGLEWGDSTKTLGALGRLRKVAD